MKFIFSAPFLICALLGPSQLAAQGFTCKSKLKVMTQQHETLLEDYNGLVRAHADLGQKRDNAEDHLEATRDNLITINDEIAEMNNEIDRLRSDNETLRDINETFIKCTLIASSLAEAQSCVK